MARIKAICGVSGLIVVSLLAARVEAQPVCYAYDLLNRLIAVVDAQGRAGIYRYDAVGNILAIRRQDAAGPVGIVLVDPPGAPGGTRVTVLGIGFSEAAGQNQVTVGGVPATVVAASRCSLTIEIPGAASSGPIVVTTPLGSATVVFSVPAITNDLRSDWSDLVNPNGSWSYDQGSSPLPQVPNWTALGASCVQPAWAPSDLGGNYLPAWFRSACNPPAGFDFQMGDVVVHTTDEANGRGEGIANVRWTSPASAIIQITGGIWNGRNIGRGNAFALSVNGSVVATGSISSADGHGRSNPLTFSVTGVPIAVNDVVELDIVRTSNFGDFVGVDLTITTAR